MADKNNWCCEITTKTFKLFREKKLYENVWERNDIFHYWGEIKLEKQFCKKCQKIVEKEKTKFKADAEEETKRLNNLEEEENCDNCGKLIKLSKKENRRERILYRFCNEHRKNDDCVVTSSTLCSLKCFKEVENEDKQYWLQKATLKDLNQELKKRKTS